MEAGAGAAAGAAVETRAWAVQMQMQPHRSRKGADAQATGVTATDVKFRLKWLHVVACSYALKNCTLTFDLPHRRAFTYTRNAAVTTKKAMTLCAAVEPFPFDRLGNALGEGEDLCFSLYLRMLATVRRFPKVSDNWLTVAPHIR